MPGLVWSASALTPGARPGDSVVLEWNEAFLQAVCDSELGPPMVARALAIAHTCIYDAWAAHDHRAVGTRLGGSLRRPPRERILANTKQAISFAAYRAAIDLFPGSTASVFDPLMSRLGYDARDHSIDTSRLAAIGNVAAQSVLDFRHRDEANQLGDEPTGGGSGTYRVTALVSWQFANFQTDVGFIDNIGGGRATNGTSVLEMVFSDGSTGVLTVGCHGPGAPPGIFEGIATTKGYKTYYTVPSPVPGVDANRTIFHVR